MYICSEVHEEIVHEGRDCPLCIATEEINDLESQIIECDKAADELKATIERLENEAASDIAGTPADEA